MSERLAESDIGSFQFTERDGIFLFIGPQVDFIRGAANPSIGRATLFSMSLHALAEILKPGHRRIVTHDNFITDPEMRTLRELAAVYERRWLSLLRCSFGIEGIDFADIDALCQYTFFRYVLFADLVGRRMLDAHPEIERIFVIRGPEPLPLDFDFDSDLGQAVIRHLCEQMGRKVIEIVTDRHHLSNGPDFLMRPYTKGWVTPAMTRASAPDAPSPRIGMVPSTVPSALRIIHDATSLNCELALFYSPWAVSAPRATTDEEEEARLKPEDRAFAASMEQHLIALRTVIGQRLANSILPPAIARNPHLGFQWDHIVTKRWLSLACLARKAAGFARVCPLDIFINPEMANWEGMILSYLYRRQGTRILVAPHSGWPGPAFDASWRDGDWAMVYSRLGTKLLRSMSGLDKVYTIGMPWVSPMRAPDWETRIAEKRRLLGGKKLVVLISNPSEVSFLPSFDQKAHFGMVGAFGRVPDHLKDKVHIAVRRRAPRACEDDSLYRSLSDLDDDALHFLDGLTFHDCVDLADCLVGINSPTSGYYEVFQNGKPLLHVQGMDILWMQPDLPADVIGRVDGIAGMWPAIERVLFDEEHRKALLDRQAAFVEEDLRSDFGEEQSPIQSLLELMLTQDRQEPRHG